MYIEKIKSPADLKKLDLKELQVVADETRQAVLNRVSKHGGHVGPNLGFVEATVALLTPEYLSANSVFQKGGKRSAHPASENSGRDN